MPVTEHVSDVSGAIECWDLTTKPRVVVADASATVTCELTALSLILGLKQVGFLIARRQLRIVEIGQLHLLSEVSFDGLAGG
jgi:hypothetical protein